MLFALDIGGEKVGIICIFYEADKPAVDILPVHSPGSGFSIEVPKRRGGDVNGVFYRFHIFRCKS